MLGFSVMSPCHPRVPPLSFAISRDYEPWPELTDNRGSTAFVSSFLVLSISVNQSVELFFFFVDSYLSSSSDDHKLCNCYCLAESL